MAETRKKYQLRDLTASEISVVDRGANPGAKIVFFKRDVEHAGSVYVEGFEYSIDPSLAARLSKRGLVEAKENHMSAIRKAASDCLDQLAITKRRNGETTEQALLRLFQERDPAAVEYYELHETLGREAAELHETLNKAHAADQNDDNDDSEDTDTDPDMEALEQAAKKIRKKTGCTREAAMLKAIEQNPAVYRRISMRNIR